MKKIYILIIIIIMILMLAASIIKLTSSNPANNSSEPVQSTGEGQVQPSSSNNEQNSQNGIYDSISNFGGSGRHSNDK
jgi:hypothetical protein